MGERLYKETGQKRYKDGVRVLPQPRPDYVNLFDPEAGFFQGQVTPRATLAGGLAKYDPRVWGYDYTETNGWDYALHRPQDSRGLANLYGGRDRPRRRSSTSTSPPRRPPPPSSRAPTAGSSTRWCEARDVRHGHVRALQPGGPPRPCTCTTRPGSPCETQKNIREVLQRLYTGSDIGQGYHGDEDNGEQSAWFLFSSLGFYPR